MFENENPKTAWYFSPKTNPFFEGWPLRAVTGEGPIAFNYQYFDDIMYQIYRCRTQKYLWAPDTYYSFLFMFQRETETRDAQLATSRNGLNWNFFEDNWYFSRGEYGESLIAYGMARFGDDIYQYGNYTKGHLKGSAGIPSVALKQRLDGFTSYDAGEKVGTFTTKAVAFDASKLFLNTNSQNGYVKVAIVNADGSPISGFTFDDCTTISSDSVNTEVIWAGGDLSALSGKEVCLKFEMQNSKLYAMEFVK